MLSLKIVSHTRFWVTNFRSSFYKELCSPNTHKYAYTTHSCTSIMNIQRQDVRLHWQFFHAKSPYCSPRWDKYRHNLVALIFCLSLCVWIQSVGSYNHLFDHTVMLSASSAKGTKNGLCGKITTGAVQITVRRWEKFQLTQDTCSNTDTKYTVLLWFPCR